MANLQHQQDGWDDQAWIGEESKDLAQEGGEIVFHRLLDDVIHSVFPTGKRRACVTAAAKARRLQQLCPHPRESGLPLPTAFPEEPELFSKELPVENTPRAAALWLGFIAALVPWAPTNESFSPSYSGAPSPRKLKNVSGEGG